MSKQDAVLIASRAIALYLVFWSVGNLVNVPPLMFSILHYGAQPVSAGQEFLYKLHLIQLSANVVLSVGLFVAAVWTYRCGPKIEAFLSPSEKAQQ